MSTRDRWLLPEGIDEVLPPEAARLERVRRSILDLFASWGYELVVPPMIEYLESLLTGLGSDLDLQTFKLIDQATGRSMGIRADMTPQVARIDAHTLKRDVPTRLCYLGSVLHTLPDGFAGSRNPLQVGAELYGHAGLESDVEILCLMVETLNQTGLKSVFVNLGHIGIFRGLVKQAGITLEDESHVFDALQRKSAADLHEILAERNVATADAAALAALIDLNGDVQVLAAARDELADSSEQVHSGIAELAKIAELVAKRAPQIELHIDLAEMRGYHYHTGVMFEAFVAGQGRALAWGGRYDDIGEVFGRARAATGFSTDLKHLTSILAESDPPAASAIFAPVDDDTALAAAVVSLRAQGECVVVGLPGQHGGAAEMGCARELRLVDGEWLALVRGTDV